MAMVDLLPFVIAIIFLAMVILAGGMLLSRGQPSVKGRKKKKKFKAKDHTQVLKEANRRLAQNP